MTWTYSGDPSTSDGDSVRFLLGDTDTNDQLLQDEEIAFLITEWDGNLYFAAAAGAESLSAKFAREVDFSGDNANIPASLLTTQFAALAGRLRGLGTKLGSRAAQPYAGGISQKDVDKVNNDLDRVPPAFSIGMHDNTWYAGGDPTATTISRPPVNPDYENPGG